ncbi:UNVERIFIED_CONTAM: hypothetical protein RMT77_011614 [Armadillidium vulgare]
MQEKKLTNKIKICKSIARYSDITMEEMPLTAPIIAEETPQNISEKCNTQENMKKESKVKIFKTCRICFKKIQYYGSHLKTHGFDPTEIKQIVHESRVRKGTKAKSVRKCPFFQCNNSAPYVRLDKHLNSYHKLSKDHHLYRRFINTHAKRIKINSNRPIIKNQEGYAAEAKETTEIAENISTSTGKPNENDPIETNVQLKSDIAIEEFFEFCKSFNGGRMKEENAVQYKNKIRQILNGVNIKYIEEIDSSNASTRLSLWFETYIQNHEESSAKFFICILIKFLKYLGIKNAKCKTHYDQIISLAQNWTKSFRTTKISMKKKIIDISEFEIRAFEASDVSRACKEKLEKLKNKNLISIACADHARIRNFIILLTILRNSCRSCVLTNMTLTELENAEKEERNGMVFHVIWVEDHKTRKEHGPAAISLEQELYEYFLCYVQRLRPLIVAVDSCINKVFVTWNGTSINSDGLYKGIMSIWKEAGLKTKLSTTLIRKIVTTRVHAKEDNQTKDNLARHLCHRQSTAEKSYKNRTASFQSVTSSQMIYKTLYGKEMVDTAVQSEHTTNNTQEVDQNEHKYSSTEVPSDSITMNANSFILECDLQDLENFDNLIMSNHESPSIECNRIQDNLVPEGADELSTSSLKISSKVLKPESVELLMEDEHTSILRESSEVFNKSFANCTETESITNNMSIINPEKSNIYRESSECEMEDDADDEEYKPNTESLVSLPRKIYSKGRPYFTPKERKLIYNVFRGYIKIPRVPEMHVIKKALETDIRMKVLKLNGKDFPVKIRGCLQNFYNKEKKKI